MKPEDFNICRHDLGNGYSLVTGELHGTKLASLFHARKRGSRTYREFLWAGNYENLQAAVARVAREKLN